MKDMKRLIIYLVLTFAITWALEFLVGTVTQALLKDNTCRRGYGE